MNHYLLIGIGTLILLLILVGFALYARRNQPEEGADDEFEQYIGDLPQVPPPRIDFSRTHLFHD